MRAVDLMTQEQLELRARFRKAAEDIKRDGIEDLLDWLDETGFYNAPASTRYHLAESGGLAKHSILVYDTIMDLGSVLNDEVPLESLAIVSLFHDIGKHRYHGKLYYQPNILKSGKPAATPYQKNKDLINVDHEISALQILGQFIDLTEDETWAILHHNGMYSNLRWQLQGQETKLQQLVHMADMWSSRFKEERHEGESIRE